MKDPVHHRFHVQKKAVADEKHRVLKETDHQFKIGSHSLSKRDRNLLLLSCTLENILTQSSLDFLDPSKHSTEKRTPKIRKRDHKFK